MKPRQCKDCDKPGRPAPNPGPRCETHWRTERKRRSAAAHGPRIGHGYGITIDQYAQLFALQGGHCAICQMATGRVRRLAVDHDHESGEVRGLLCGPCNLMIGRLGDTGLLRALNYLAHPPARALL